MAKKKTTTKNEVKEVKASEKTITRGIIIACLDQPYYGNYAFQLALSIKHTAPNMPIALLCNDAGKGHLTQDKLVFFERLQSIVESIHLKAHSFQLSWVLLASKYRHHRLLASYVMILLVCV